MATITRNHLFEAIENSSDEFVSRNAKRRLIHWAHDADSFTVGDWDNCPLDQAGLVKEFEKRSRYAAEENTRFANEASELDAQILQRLDKNNLGGEVTKLLIYVR